MQPVGRNHCRRFNIRLARRAKDFNHHPFGVIGPLGTVHDFQDDLVTHIDVFGIGVALTTNSPRSRPSGSAIQPEPCLIMVPVNRVRRRCTTSTTRPELRSPRRPCLTSACTTSPVIAPPVSSAAMYRSPSANGVAGRTKPNPRGCRLNRPSMWSGIDGNAKHPRRTTKDSSSIIRSRHCSNK